MNEESFHIAKLALFNVHLLSDIESKRIQVPSLGNIVIERSRFDNVALPINLIHQATFLQFAYITLVWLWEQANVSEMKDAFESGITKRFQFANITKLSGPRDFKNPRDLLTLLRNAISHGLVSFEDDRVVFTDINRRKEQLPTKVAMKWSDLGQLSEAVLFSTNDLLYPPNVRTGV